MVGGVIYVVDWRRWGGERMGDEYREVRDITP